MGSTATTVSLEEYLNTTYEPDRELVEGVLVERNLGTKRHGRLQTILGWFLEQYSQSHGVTVFTDTRLRVGSGRHRIPDTMVVEGLVDEGKVVTDVPVITVEIESPEDKFDDIFDKCFEYEALGVPHIIVMDPFHRRAWLFKESNLRLLEGDSIQLTLQSGALDFPFAEMFAKVDAHFKNQS